MSRLTDSQVGVSMPEQNRGMASYNTLCIDLQCALELLQPFFPLLAEVAQIEVDRLWVEQEARGYCTTQGLDMEQGINR